jgi:DNA-binding NarL/FixJ family response regulator
MARIVYINRSDKGCLMKVLVVDDHAFFRAGLRLLLQSVRPDTVVLESASVKEALHTASEHSDLRLCFLDLHLPNESGLDALVHLKTAAPEIAVVVVSADDRYQAISQSLDAGAMGYIPKSSDPSQLALAIVKLLSGEIYLPKGATGGDSKGRKSPPQLSDRQRDVFHCLMRGLPNKLICRELGLSENTVKSHLAAIYRAFDVHTRSELMFIVSEMSMQNLTANGPRRDVCR